MISEKASTQTTLTSNPDGKLPCEGKKKTLGKGLASRPSKKTVLAPKKAQNFPNKTTLGLITCRR